MLTIKRASSLSAVLVIALAALAQGQSLEDKLMQPVDSFESHSDSTCGQLIDLAQRFVLPLGIELLAEQNVRVARPVQIRSGTVQEALEEILHQTRYKFRVGEGVVHVFDKSLLDDPRNFLNIRFPEFGYKDQSLSAGSYELRVQIQVLLHPDRGYGGGHGGVSQPRDFDLPRITFEGNNLTVRQILNNMAREEGNALWVVVTSKKRMIEDEPYYAPMAGYKGTEVSARFGWQFVALQLHAFDELTFAKAFVEQLTKAGFKVHQIGRSTMEGRFNHNYDAATIMTDKGSVDAVFFADPAQANHIRVTDLGTNSAGHYVYSIENLPEPAQTWETADVHYFTSIGNVFLITRDAAMYEALKRLIAEQP